jgi:ABC-type transport system involved in cytochrome c biogenesis permease subunit
MKKFLPILALLVALGFVAKLFIPPSNAPDNEMRPIMRRAETIGAVVPDPKTPPYDIVGFSQLPVVVNGRIKPFDTVARTTLLVLQGRQRVSTPELSVPLTQNPTEWLLDVMFRSAKADGYPTFRIESPEVLSLMGLSDEDTKINYTSTAKRIMAVVGFLPTSRSRFSYQQLEPKLAELDRQVKLAEPVEAQLRTPFQKAVVQLHANVLLYQRLKYSLVSPAGADFLRDLGQFQDKLADGVAAVRAKEAKEPHDEALAQQIISMGERSMQMSQAAYLIAVPPLAGENHINEWKNTGDALLDSFQTGRVNPYVMMYAGLAHTWSSGQSDQFNHIVQLYREQLDKSLPQTMRKCTWESRLNSAEPFYASMELYVGAFLLAVFSWLKWPEVLGKAAFRVLVVAWVIATAGILARMWLEGRPPVTNLYSSALFIGWGAVTLCIVLELTYRNAIGTVAAGLIGFGTLLIAHHLSLSGDTMEMMRAVLDSNFWLATHVVTVTIGYSATFLSGFLAIIYVVMGVFTPWLSKQPTPEGARAVAVAATSPALFAVANAVAKRSETNGDMLTRMVYGIVCFATLFSFVGTVLGGIWADQSWGRFWGWDPKENGALIIVIWNAIILHARWGGLVKQRGLMALAIFGNVVTAWSWFGTNMLGIGLHSYGFTEAAFYALIAFVVSQIVLIALASTPLAKWRSFALTGRT